MPHTTVYDMVPLLPHAAHTNNSTNRNVFRAMYIYNRFKF